MSCKGCGKCCTSYLPVLPKEVDEIRKYLRTHNVKVREYGEDVCPFLTEENKCGIYNSRPSYCRAFECSKDSKTKELPLERYTIRNFYKIANSGDLGPETLKEIEENEKRYNTLLEMKKRRRKK